MMDVGIPPTSLLGLMATEDALALSRPLVGPPTPPPAVNVPPVKPTRCRRLPKDPKANLRRSRHRDSEKRELMYLRACADALERELSQLKRRGRSKENADSGGALTVQTAMWRAIARRSRLEREQSESENAQLHALLQNQVMFAAQVRRCASVPRNVGPANGDFGRVRFNSVDLDTFQVLLGDLDAIYRASDAMLQNVGLAGHPTEQCRAVHDREGGDSGKLDLIGVTSIHSSFQDSRPPLWKSILGNFLAHGGVRHQVSEKQQADKVMTMKFRYVRAKEGDDEPAGLDITLAIKNYLVAPDKFVVVWKSLNSGDGTLTGLDAVETGCSVMFPAPTEANCTIVKRVRRMEPMGVQASSRRLDEKQTKSLVHEFSSLSLSVMEDDIQGAIRSVDVE